MVIGRIFSSQEEGEGLLAQEIRHHASVAMMMTAVWMLAAFYILGLRWSVAVVAGYAANTVVTGVRLNRARKAWQCPHGHDDSDACPECRH